ncbi:putative PE family protein [Mycobacterium tuberculosis]|nr:putative PE family protein [Mycobacterium tuberculosis]
MVRTGQRLGSPVGPVDCCSAMAATALPVPSGRWAAPAGRPGYLGSAAPVARAGGRTRRYRRDGWMAGGWGRRRRYGWGWWWRRRAGGNAGLFGNGGAGGAGGLVVAPAARAVTRGGLVMGALAAWVV